MKANPEITAIIMAGGESSRFGNMTQATPKGLLRISPTETLLTRLLTQLSKAGIHSATVCASTANHDVFRRFVEQHPQNLRVIVHSCEDTRLGPIPALASTLSCMASENFLCVLSDLYFDSEDPFSPLTAKCLAADSDATILSGRLNECNLGTPSGYLTYEHDLVKHISYASMPELQHSSQWGNWTGCFLGGPRLRAHLAGVAQLLDRLPLESWLQSAIDAGMRCRHSHIGSFANVNTPGELDLLAQRIR